MENEGKATVKIFRFDPSSDKGPRYETYEIPQEVWKDRQVMHVLQYIYQNLAPGLSFRESCYQGLCGCCTVRVNGKPVLSCDALASQEMMIEPLHKDKVVKDLIS
jgi:succinate dehydrogenase / fumarate reductase, iron-sulfur subunit